MASKRANQNSSLCQFSYSESVKPLFIFSGTWEFSTAITEKVMQFIATFGPIWRSTWCPYWLRQKTAWFCPLCFAGNIIPPRFYTYKGCYVHLACIPELLPRSVIKTSVSWSLFLKKNSSTDPAPEAGRSVQHYAVAGSPEPQMPAPARCASLAFMLSCALSDTHCLAWENCPAAATPGAADTPLQGYYRKRCCSIC